MEGISEKVIEWGKTRSIALANEICQQLLEFINEKANK